MRNFVRLFFEVWRVFKVLPLGGFVKWCWFLLLRVPQVLREKSLGPVDLAFGSNFVVTMGKRRIRFESCAFGVIREIFGSECYISRMELRGMRRIVDFGANAGAFTLFALGSDPYVSLC